MTGRGAAARALVRHQPAPLPPHHHPQLGTARRRATRRYEETVGIRTFRFDPDHGFFINGERAHAQGRVPARGCRLPRHRGARRRLAAPAAQAQGDGLQRRAHGAQPARPRALPAVRRARLLRHRRGVRRVGERQEQVVAGPQRLPAAAPGLRQGLPRLARARPRRHGRRPPQPPLDHRLEHRQRDRLPQRSLRQRRCSRR